MAYLNTDATEKTTKFKSSDVRPRMYKTFSDIENLFFKIGRIISSENALNNVFIALNMP